MTRRRSGIEWQRQIWASTVAGRLTGIGLAREVPRVASSLKKLEQGRGSRGSGRRQGPMVPATRAGPFAKGLGDAGRLDRTEISPIEPGMREPHLDSPPRLADFVDVLLSELRQGI